MRYDVMFLWLSSLFFAKVCQSPNVMHRRGVIAGMSSPLCDASPDNLSCIVSMVPGVATVYLNGGLCSRAQNLTMRVCRSEIDIFECTKGNVFKVQESMFLEILHDLLLSGPPQETDPYCWV